MVSSTLSSFIIPSVIVLMKGRSVEDTQVLLGEKLKMARQEAHLKQRDVAQVLNVSISVVSALESGHRKVDAMELFRLSKLYGKPMHWFFDEPHPLSELREARWHDSDPLVRECIHLFRQASPVLRKKAAYGVIGFLSDR